MKAIYLWFGALLVAGLLLGACAKSNISGDATKGLTCSDSESTFGWDQFTPGVSKLKNGNTVIETKADVCTSIGSLKEYNCKGQGSRTHIEEYTYSCSCKDGACRKNCGDGTIQSPEQCDDGTNNGACPKACSPTCTLNDCTAYCGDGVKNGAEECDLGVANGACPAACTKDCKISDCNFCGDGVKNAAEECDKGDAEHGAGNGACPKGCSENCKFNPCGTCGDGTVNSNMGETCDDGTNNGACPKTCSPTCTVNDCTLICGDGKVTSPEQCDGTNLNGKTCVLLGYGGGALGCTSACKYDTKKCSGTPPTNIVGG